ncbi:MAG: DTW domain-containing protein YfiP [Verrucomicrobiales bacterium]
MRAAGADAFEQLLAEHPRLRIVCEHITTKEATEFVRNAPEGQVGATITPQHLLYTLGHLIQGLKYHLFSAQVSPSLPLIEATVSSTKFGTRAAGWHLGMKSVKGERTPPVTRCTMPDSKRLNLCLNCRRRLATCVCAHLRPFPTTSRFLILMHPKEFKKEKVGTGRFSHLILQNSEVIVGINFDESVAFREMVEDERFQSVVVYPGRNAIDLSKPKAASQLGRKTLQFIVIDGTWQCAKKMMKLTTSLHALPRVSFTAGRTSEFQVKHQPHPECLSTAESLHQVVQDLNKLGIEDTRDQEENLMFVFRKTVQQQIDFANDPNRRGYRKKPYTLPSERVLSKRWGNRPLFFNSLNTTTAD